MTISISIFLWYNSYAFKVNSAVTTAETGDILGTILLKGSHHSDTTFVSNDFIDHYMTNANEAQIKIYLYLLRCIGANAPVSVSDIADRFNYTEKDILRALHYWDREKLISLEFDGNNNVVGICMNEPGRIRNASDTMSSLPPDGKQEEVKEHMPCAKQPDTDHEICEKPSYPTDRLNDFKSREEVQQLIFMTEHYMGKTLSATDLNTLLFMYDKLQFPLDLIEYLIEYCVNNNHKSMRYIEKTALNWADEGLRTVKAAKENNSRYKKEYFAVLKAYGISGRNPVDSDIDYIKRWKNEYGFDLDVIIEACNRTMKAIAKPSFAYTDSILKSWKSKNIHHTSDLKSLDTSFRKERTESLTAKVPVAPRPNRFKNFKEHDCDFDKLAMDLIRN